MSVGLICIIHPDLCTGAVDALCDDIDDLLSNPPNLIGPNGLPILPNSGPMFNDSPDDDVVIDDDGSGTVEITHNGPNGPVTIVGDTSMDDGTLTIGGPGGAHIDGPGAGSVGLSGIREAGRAIGKKYGAKEVIIQGGTRTTGANIGKKPRPIRIPVK